MTDEELQQKVKNGLDGVASASATLASLAPTNETVAAASVMKTLNTLANRPDESKPEKSPEEKALDELRKANAGATNIAGLVAGEEKAAKAITDVEKTIPAKSTPEKAKTDDETHGKDRTLSPQKGEHQKKPEDKEKDDKDKEKDDKDKDKKKKVSSQEYEEGVRKKYSNIELPSGLIVKAEGQAWNLYDKNGNYMDITSQMNQLIAHNKGVDEANQAMDKRAGKEVKVNENDLPIRDSKLKDDMVDSSVNKISTGDLKPEKDTFDLKKLEAPDMKKLAEAVVDRAFDENNLKLLRELEEKKKENENKKDKNNEQANTNVGNDVNPTLISQVQDRAR